MDFIAVAVVSFIAGFVLSGIFKVDVRISKKEDYETKKKELEALIEGFSKDKVEFRPQDLFPADINKDYGIPRDLK
jgi:hypothetical protein